FAIAASSTAVSKPGNTNALPQRKPAAARPQFHHPTDDFVAGNQRELAPRQLAVHHVQIGAADTAGFDLKAQLAGAGTGCRAIDQFERSADLSQAHGSHGNLRCYWNTTPMIQCSASGGL